MKRVTVKIAGPAGMGIKSGGLVLAKIITRSGYYFADYSEYPSLIRGGHNVYTITFSPEEVYMVDSEADIYIALAPGHGEGLPIPLAEMTEKLGGSIYANTISLGVLVQILGLNYDLAKKIVGDHFGQDSKNLEAFEMGSQWAKNNSQRLTVEKAGGNQNRKMIVDGNEAIGWGLYKGGCDFFAAYPMTPTTGVLHFLAKNQDDFKMKVYHPEDEIAVASWATGASIAGSRPAVATSGGGFALMNETVSLNGMMGAGVVYVMGQRPGPATGMPTWTAQGDLLYTVFAGHGEFPKIVLAPGDTQECFEMSREAMNLAAKFDVPVIILVDKMLCEAGKNVIDLFGEKEKIVKSKKKVPGDGAYVYNSYEHDSEGYSVEGEAEAKAGVEARLKKTEEILKDIIGVNILGNKDAKNLIISWGSTKGAILEAIKDNKDYAYLQIKTLWPISKDLETVINGYKNKILVENNANGQLGQLLKSQMNINFDKKFLKYDGRPFFPDEIKNFLISNDK